MRAAVCITLVIAIVMVGCNSNLRAAAQRFAQQVGRSADDADDIEAAFRKAMSGSTDDEIASAISSASSRTQWMDDVAAAAARQDEQLRTLQTVASSTCTIVEVAGQLEQAGLDGLTGQEVNAIIANHLRLAGLPETEQKVSEIWSGIDSQLRSLQQTGSIDWSSAWLDLGCFAIG